MFELLQIIYWLALSTWFGSVLFIAVAAPVVMRSVRESNPVIPSILSVNLEGQHGTLLGGAIVGTIMQLVRNALFLAAVGLLVYQWRALWPRMWRFRQEYIDHADEPDVANPALDQFDRLQHDNAIVLVMLLAALLGIILFSANIYKVYPVAGGAA